MLTYTETGEKWTHLGKQRLAIEAEIEKLKWYDLVKDLRGPMSPILCLEGICKEIPGRHQAIAWNGVLFNRYGLYGLKTAHKDGMSWSYWMDQGVGAVCLCSEFIPKGKELIYEWLKIGMKNAWISEATDPLFDENSFQECGTLEGLADSLGNSNWCEGTAFYFQDVCFINQVRGGNEWLVIHKGVSFESLTGNFYGGPDPESLARLQDFVARVQVATVEQLRKCEY